MCDDGLLLFCSEPLDQKDTILEPLLAHISTITIYHSKETTLTDLSALEFPVQGFFLLSYFPFFLLCYLTFNCRRTGLPYSPWYFLPILVFTYTSQVSMYACNDTFPACPVNGWNHGKMLRYFSSRLSFF